MDNSLFMLGQRKYKVKDRRCDEMVVSSVRFKRAPMLKSMFLAHG